MSAHNEQHDPASAVVKQNLTTQPAAAQEAAPWRDHDAAIDAKALSTATEIALMWGQDRSQFISRIQVAVIDAMRWVKGGLQPAAAQEAVCWQRKYIGATRGNRPVEWHTITKDEFEATKAGKWADRYEVRALYAAPVTAAPGIDLTGLRARVVLAIRRITSGAAPMRVPADMTDPDLVLGDVLTLLDTIAPQIDASPKGDDVPLIDLVSDILTDLSNVAGSWVVEAAGASADAQNECASQMHDAIERWSNRLRLDDASPKYALPTLPDDFSESKDWRAGSYGERVEWLMDTVRSQREHIDSLLDSPKGGSEARDAARYRWLRDLSGNAPIHTPAAVLINDDMDDFNFIDGPQLDDAIDAAMAAQAGDAEVQP